MTDFDLLRNSEGYYDPTAYNALLKVINHEKEHKTMEKYFKGDLVRARQNNGLEKEYVIIAVHERYCTVLMLAEDDTLPIAIRCNVVKYTDPGMLQFMYTNNILSFIRALTDEEIDNLMKAVFYSLGWEGPDNEKKPATKEDIKNTKVLADTAIELAKVTAERDVYKSLYMQLLESFTEGV